jgi:hypothetical protein
MTIVYLVHHYDSEPDDGIDYDKVIGFYSSRELAQQAIGRLHDKPGFRECPQGWKIADIILDKDDAWRDGFATMINGVEQVVTRQ